MRRFVMLAAAVMAFSALAGATTINGSIVLTSLGAVLNGTNLADSTLLQPVGLIGTPGVFTGLSTGDYAAFIVGTDGAGGTIDTTNINSFGVTFAGYGVFSATSGVLVSQSTNFLDVYFLGNFVPEVGGPLAGFETSPTSVRISLNFTGESTSYSGTLASPPQDNPIPEPGTYAMLGAGLIGLFMLRRKAA
jgi:hypothetical protein